MTDQTGSSQNLWYKLFIPFIILVFISLCAHSQTTSWKGTAGNTWSDPANWTNGVPTATTDVIVGDANFTGWDDPDLTPTDEFKSITIGGVKSAIVQVYSSRSIEHVTLNANGRLIMGKGTLTITGNWTNNGGTYSFHSQTLEEFNGANQVIGGTANSQFKWPTIKSGAVVTFSKNVSTTNGLVVSGTFIPDPNTNPIYTGNISVSNGGLLKVNASTYAGNYSSSPSLSSGSAIEYSADGNQTVSNFTYSTLIISGSGTKTPASSLTALVSSSTTFGNLYINGGILNLAALTANRGTSTTGGEFSIAAGATLRLSGASNFPANYATYSLDPASTVEYYGGVQSIKAETYGHLTISASGTKTAAGACTINGNFNLSLGTFAAGSHTHTIRGNWNMVSGAFTHTGTIVFSGSATQSVTSTGNFYRVTINKTGGQVSLASNITVTNTLSFTSKNIKTNSFKVIIPSTGTVSGATQATGWVAGNLQKNFTAGLNVTRTFEVGDEAYYSPVTTLMASVVLAGNLTAGVTAGDHPQLASSTLEPTKSINKYWSFSSSTVTFTTATLTFNWNAGDMDAGVTTGNFLVGAYNLLWTTPTVSNRTGTSIQTTGNILLKDFVVAETQCTRGTWLGTLTGLWSNPLNWSCGVVPDSSIDVTIPSGLLTYPVITLLDAAAKNITIQSGATLTVSNATLSIFGNITKNGTFTATDGIINLKGTTTQNIPANTFSGNTINELIINNAAGVTLGGSLSITDLLTISNGSLNTGGFLTLKSTALKTAQVATITSASATPIVGNVNVERYVPGRRKYRIITSSVTTSASSTLSVGQEAQSIWGNWQAAGSTAQQNVGTSITGGLAADGFDIITNSSSMFTYDAVNKRFIAHSSANGKNTKYTPLKAGVAYYMFVYGDRQNSAVASNPRATVLSATGTLLTGDQIYNPTSAIPLSADTGKYTMVGNPYAAMLDWKSVQLRDISKTIHGWDPNLSSTGGYVTVTATAAGAIIAPVSDIIKVGRYIQPGQGFFVKTTGPAPQMIIKEVHKVTNKDNLNNLIFRTTEEEEQKIMAINLLYTAGTNKLLSDGVVAAFDTSFSNQVNDEDGLKINFSSNTESLALLNDGQLLGIDTRKMPTTNDTLVLNMSRVTRPQYTLQIFLNNLGALNLQPYLHDSYLAVNTPLSLTDTNHIVFNVVSSDPLSSAANRFKIFFKSNSILPVAITSVSAVSKGPIVQVDWKVSAESGTEKYDIMKSADGMQFKKVGEISARGGLGLIGYQWLDHNPVDGNNFYRVDGIQVDGSFRSSKVVMATFGNMRQVQLVVNPVKNQKLIIALHDVAKDKFQVTLYNMHGQVVYNKSVAHQGGSATYTLWLNRNLAAGLYHLKVSTATQNFSRSVIIE